MNLILLRWMAFTFCGLLFGVSLAADPNLWGQGPDSPHLFHRADVFDGTYEFLVTVNGQTLTFDGHELTDEMTFVLVVRSPSGDANADGVVDNLDISAFFLAPSMPAVYAAAFPGVTPDVVLDMNSDRVSNDLEIAGFGGALDYCRNLLRVVSISWSSSDRTSLVGKHYIAVLKSHFLPKIRQLT